MSAAEVKNSQCAQRNPEFLHVFISSLLRASHSTVLLLLLLCCVVGWFFFCASASEAVPSKRVRNYLPLMAYYRRISISTSDSPQTPVIPLGTCVMQSGKKKKKKEIRLAQTSPTVTLMLLISQIHPQTYALNAPPLMRVVIISL